MYTGANHGAFKIAFSTLIVFEKFADNDSQDLLDENQAQNLKEFPNSLAVDKSTVSGCSHALRRNPKGGKMTARRAQLTETVISKRFNIVVAFLGRQKKTSLLWRVVTGDEV